MTMNDTIKDIRGFEKYISRVSREVDTEDKDIIEVYKVYDYDGNKRYYETNSYNERWSRVVEMEREYR